MRQVLADLAVESEAATLTMLRLAAAYDAGDERVQPPGHRRRQVLVLQAHPDVRRRGAGVLRRQRLRRDRADGPAVPGEPAQRHLGGQRQRHRPRRRCGRSPASPTRSTALLAEIEAAAGADARFDRFVADLHAELAELGDGDPQAKARRLTERLALALQGSLLLRYSRAAVAEAFCASRLAGGGGLMFGALPDGVDATAIVERAWP